MPGAELRWPCLANRDTRRVLELLGAEGRPMASSVLAGRLDHHPDTTKARLAVLRLAGLVERSLLPNEPKAHQITDLGRAALARLSD